MTKPDKSIFKPVNDPVKPQSQVSSCIEIQGFNRLVEEGEISTIQVFYERVAQEIYNARKKNYSWGFKVIEPEFLNHSDRIFLSSRARQKYLLMRSACTCHQRSHDIKISYRRTPP